MKALMVSKCKQCGNELTGKRTFCNDKCRMRYNQYVSAVVKVGAQPEQIKPNNKPEQANPNEPEQIDNDPNIARIRGNGQGVTNFGLPDCQCKQCQAYRLKGKDVGLLNHGPYKPATQLVEHEVNRVSLPGDRDYAGVGIC